MVNKKNRKWTKEQKQERTKFFGLRKTRNRQACSVKYCQKKLNKQSFVFNKRLDWVCSDECMGIRLGWATSPEEHHIPHKWKYFLDAMVVYDGFDPTKINKAFQYKAKIIAEWGNK